MDPDGSITRWIGQLKRGERGAAPPLWEADFHRLVALARHSFRGSPRGADDEEDVALVAFDRLYRRAERGQFPKLHNRDDLWHLISVITVRKAIDLRRREARQPGLGAWGRPLWAQAERNLERLLSSEPTPEFTAMVSDECRRLLDVLAGVDGLLAVALWKMERQTNAAIAARLEVVESTVSRRLRHVRDHCTREGVS
jgi:DNA-directed RNA polymerase specialized sigma24 family protein